MTATVDTAIAAPGGPLTGIPDLVDPLPVASGLAGQVFRARQPSTDRLVAVKVAGVAVLDPQVQGRFSREIATAGRLSDHPCLVTVLSHGVSPSGYPYLVMPWYALGSLADELRRRGSIPVPEILTLGIRIATGLDHVHGRGVVHRDVKPSNILLSGYGEAVLADFGGATNARYLGTVTTSYTPVHAAPELLQDELATPRADVWSLASTVWTALAGTRPFALPDRGSGPDGGQRSQQTGLAGELSRAAAGDLGPLGVPGVPASLESVLAMALSPAPADRPNAREFAQSLRDVQLALGLDGGEICSAAVSSASAPTLPPHPRLDPTDPVTIRRPAPVAPPPARRHRTHLIAGIALSAAAVLAATAAGAGLGFDRPASARADDVALHAAVAASAPAPPVAPQQAGFVFVLAHGSTSITLAWQDTNAGQARYLVLVEPAPGGSALQTATHVNEHTVAGLRPRTSYCFQVLTGQRSGAPITTPICAQTD